MNPPGYLMEDPSLSRGRLMTMFLSISSRVAGVGTGEGKIGSECKMVKMYRDGEGRWDVGQKPKSKVVLKEGQETEDKDKDMEMVDQETADKEIVPNKAITRKLEKIVIKP